MNAASIRWWEVEVRVPGALADDAAALAIGAGADGAEIAEAGEQSALLRLSFAGERLESEVTIITRDALAELGLACEPDVRERTDTDWSERWKEHFEPLQLGTRVWIVPSWHRSFAPPEGAITIEIDPGMAFGTGQHATTALCIEWIERHLTTRDPETQSVLDVGCGSGILSMLCDRLGARRVVGVDNDPVAVEVARDNARINGIDIDFGEQPLASVPGQFDVVVANILAHVLCDLAPELVAHTRAGGWLIVSGLLEEQEAEVVAALASACAAAGRPAFAPHARLLREKWLALAGQL